METSFLRSMLNMFTVIWTAWMRITTQSSALRNHTGEACKLLAMPLWFHNHSYMMWKLTQPTAMVRYEHLGRYWYLLLFHILYIVYIFHYPFDTLTETTTWWSHHCFSASVSLPTVLCIMTHITVTWPNKRHITNLLPEPLRTKTNK